MTKQIILTLVLLFLLGSEMTSKSMLKGNNQGDTTADTTGNEEEVPNKTIDLTQVPATEQEANEGVDLTQANGGQKIGKYSRLHFHVPKPTITISFAQLEKKNRRRNKRHRRHRKHRKGQQSFVELKEDEKLETIPEEEEEEEKKTNNAIKNQSKLHFHVPKPTITISFAQLEKKNRRRHRRHRKHRKGQSFVELKEDDKLVSFAQLEKKNRRRHRRHHRKHRKGQSFVELKEDNKLERLETIPEEEEEEEKKTNNAIKNQSKLHFHIPKPTITISFAQLEKKNRRRHRRHHRHRRQ